MKAYKRGEEHHICIVVGGLAIETYKRTIGMYVNVGTSFLVFYYKSPACTFTSYCIANIPFTIGIQASLQQYNMVKDGHKKVVF